MARQSLFMLIIKYLCILDILKKYFLKLFYLFMQAGTVGVDFALIGDVSSLRNGTVPTVTAVGTYCTRSVRLLIIRQTSRYLSDMSSVL